MRVPDCEVSRDGWPHWSVNVSPVRRCFQAAITMVTNYCGCQQRRQRGMPGQVAAEADSWTRCDRPTRSVPAAYPSQAYCTFCSTRGFLLSLPRGRLVTSHLKFGTTYPSISGFALPYQPSNVTSKRTYLNSIYTSLPPSSSPSDCLRLRFSMLADTVRVTNVCIIIIIIIIIISIDRVKWRHISMVAIRSSFCRSRPSYCA